MKSLLLRKSSWSLGSLWLLPLLAGCYRDQPPAPAVAATAPPAAAPAVAAPEETFVEAAPPPPQNDVMVASPGPGFVWVGGYWGWHGGRHEHEWVRGHWERPPQPRATWVQPRWEHRGHGYVFIRGYWR